MKQSYSVLLALVFLSTACVQEEGVHWHSFGEAAGETDGNDDPASAFALMGSPELALNQGLLLNGVLERGGWNAETSPPAFQTHQGCDAIEVFEDELNPGFYVGDIDFLTVQIAADAQDAQLCGMVSMIDEQVGWDLLLLELDECGSPVGLVTEPGGGALLGFGMGGTVGSWSTPVDAGSRYALLFTAYTALYEPVQYRLGASITAESEEGCPVLPE